MPTKVINSYWLFLWPVPYYLHLVFEFSCQDRHLISKSRITEAFFKELILFHIFLTLKVHVKPTKQTLRAVHPDPLTPTSDQDGISSYKPTSDENKENDQLGDYWLTWYQIHKIIRIEWQTVRRIANEILGMKVLTVQSNIPNS